MNYCKSNIRSIGELMVQDGGRNLTPVFKGNIFPTLIKVSSEEFESVRGNSELMKELAVKKLNTL